MDPLFSTILFGSGLLVCGFLLGKGPWTRAAEANIMKVLYDEKLLVPHEVVAHFTAKLPKTKETTEKK